MKNFPSLLIKCHNELTIIESVFLKLTVRSVKKVLTIGVLNFGFSQEILCTVDVYSIKNCEDQ